MAVITQAFIAGMGFTCPFSTSFFKSFSSFMDILPGSSVGMSGATLRRLRVRAIFSSGNSR